MKRIILLKQAMGKSITISIIIPCFNGEKYIKGCLGAILKSEFTDYEVIIIDDASTDKSRQILKNYQKFPRIKLIFQKTNQGPAKARNTGATETKSKYLLFLDIDTEMDKNCLKNIVAKLEQDKKVGAVQLRLMERKTGKMETAGHFLSIVGFPYEIGGGEDLENHHQEKVIFGARSAAMAIRKDLFTKIGGFDEDYFLYGEDTDLSWRVWLAGCKVIFLPKTVIYHWGKSSLREKTHYRLFYEGAKNNTNYILKNASIPLLLFILPLHILVWIFLGLKLILERRLTLAVWLYKGLWWNLRNIEKTLIKRKNIASFSVNNHQSAEIMFGPLKIRQLLRKGFSWALRT